MPLLAALLGNAFSGVVAFFAAVMSKKLATSAALAAFLVAGWVALQAGIYAAWTALNFTIPAVMVMPLSFVAAVLPSNTSACISAIVLAKIGRWLWDRQREWAVASAQS